MKNSTEKRVNRKTTSYIKQVVINLTNTELIEEQKSLLNLGTLFQQLKEYRLWTLFRLQCN